MKAALELTKKSIAVATSWTAESVYKNHVYLGIDYPPEIPEDSLRRLVSDLSQDQRNLLYEKIWELGKMDDASISGWGWGENHCFDDLLRLRKALHRLGHVGEDGLFLINRLPYAFGEGGLGSQYFSLTERKDREPPTGALGIFVSTFCFSFASNFTFLSFSR